MPSKFDLLGAPQQAPSRFDQLGSADAAPSGSRFDQLGTPSDTADEGSDYNLPAALTGAAVLAAGGYYAYKHPETMVGKIGSYLNAARQQLMLSGLALPKSILGNVGAVVAKSAEEGSFSPLKEFFSPETWNDAKAAYSAGSEVGPSMGKIPGVNLPGPMPGRIMGAMDTATQGALRRAGSTPYEAEAELFQTPLGGRSTGHGLPEDVAKGMPYDRRLGDLGQTLDSPTAKYVFPFRRTPYNQFIEGLRTFKGDYAHKGVRNAYMVAGGVHGALTSDEQYPMTLPLATAAAAKYGVPYAGAAMIGRALVGGKGNGGAAGSILPTSEYGLEQSLTDPLAPFTNPSGLRVLSKFFGGK